MNLIIARKDAVIDLDSIVAIFHDASGFQSLDGKSRSVTIHLNGGTVVTILESDPHYAYWLAYMRRPSLEDVRSREIVNAAFDPFLHEKFQSIYLLFQEIPEHEELVLCVETDEIGTLRHKSDLSEIVLSWASTVEAVDCLHSYKVALEEGAE